MSIRKASTALQPITANPALVEREPVATVSPLLTYSLQSPASSLHWQGKVRLAADRASGISAARWQHDVRTSLLERVLALGFDHQRGPHGERPDAARRLLAHLDALAEAGLSLHELPIFAEQTQLDTPGTLWILTLLFGCLSESNAATLFEDWITSLDASLFLTYSSILEVAEAVAIQPLPTLRDRAPQWLEGPSEVLCAVALETLIYDQMAEGDLLRLSRTQSPLIQVALERLVARFPKDKERPNSKHDVWMDLNAPALAYEVVRTHILDGDVEPIDYLRQRDARAIDALGPYAVDVFALAGKASDQDVVVELVRGFPTTATLLDAMGRVGFPALFQRIAAELESDELDEEAHEALITALGPQVEWPSAQAWEQVIAALDKTSTPVRLRGGKPHGVQSILREMKRPELSVQDLRVRADEVYVAAGKQVHVPWEAFGVSLDAALAHLNRVHQSKKEG